MRALHTALLLAPLLACAGNPDRHTLAQLRDVQPDMSEVQVENSLEEAMAGYRSFLEQAPESALTPEAMRRLADLKLEKQYGILGGDAIRELPAPRAARADGDAGTQPRPRAAGIALHPESEQDFESRALAGAEIEGSDAAQLDLPDGRDAATAGPLEAIALYDQILAEYPHYEHNDRVLYQKARAFDELGRVEEAVGVIDRLIAGYPLSRHIDEVQFRRAEHYFTRKRYLDAEESYLAIVESGEASEYYELALYKLGWTFYKQELHEEALHRYVALLDYKVSSGYDFDQKEDEDSERRIADTFRVISLCFSSIGGPESVEEYFAARGHKSYEDRVYSQLGEFYLEKLRYNDAALAYQTFVGLNPLHRSAPHFSMRVVEIYEAGGFPKLVLDAKKDFAASYGLQSEYWRSFDVAESPDVLLYLRSNLEDLASHYHALYQETELAEERPGNFDEALRWYRAYLGSFPEDTETPAIHYRLADLLLENADFGTAAREYERTAYEYPAHEQAAAAGYAAIYAHREHEQAAGDEDRQGIRREAIASTLRFVGAFPEHEQAAAVLGAAVDDLYEMKDHEVAIATGHRLIDEYPDADPDIRRGAFSVVAHSSFDLAAYAQAEQAYARVLEMTPEQDEQRQAVIDNLAASIYQQGEQAAATGDDRAAASHFLRVAEAAPGSGIRPAAEYDAAAALIRLEEWGQAASVLDAFREAYPEHELHREATRQMAFVYQQEGDLARAAGEYVRVADEAQEPAQRREALLVAGDLYEQSQATDQALSVYLRYVDEFPEPIEAAVETRFKLAAMHEAAGDHPLHHEQLRRIVAIDGDAGGERTPRVRYLAARSALVLCEALYREFEAIELAQPFDQNLKHKQLRMQETLDAFGRLVDYEVGEVTAAATFYMAQVYFEFSHSLLASERPTGLTPAELQDYELVLEEEAFPFEERAIEVHQKNLELLSAGIYNRWIEQSLARLAELMPGRYAKFEASSGFLASIDSYAYRSPRAQPATPEELPVELVEVAPPFEEEAPAEPAPVAPLLEDETAAVLVEDEAPAEPAPVAPLLEDETAAVLVEDAAPAQPAPVAPLLEDETAAVLVEDAAPAQPAPVAPAQDASLEVGAPPLAPPAASADPQEPVAAEVE